VHRVVTAVVVVLLFGAPVGAAERVQAGVLEVTSSAPIFVGVDKGPEPTFFQAAAPIATALVTAS